MPAAKTWFVMIPPGDTGKSDNQKRQDDFRVSYPAGSQAWKDANAGRIVQGAEGSTGNPQLSLPLVKWKGPFATEAEANTAQAPLPNADNPVADAASAATNAVPGLSQIGAFFSALGQANTWIRVAKVVAGGLLLVVGLVHITGADNAVASAARKIPLPI